MRSDFNFWLPLDVRWGDMDSYGHVNNAAYFTYCESARMAYFDTVDLDLARAEPDHGPALAQATCNFRQQVHYPAQLDVGARTTRLGTKSFNLAYEIFRRDTDEVVCDGDSVVVWVDYSKGQAITIPDLLRANLSKLDGASWG